MIGKIISPACITTWQEIQLRKIIETLLSITTPGHLLYGSDYPYVNAQVVGSSLDKLRKLLTNNPEWEKWTHDILNGNAIKLFKK